VRFPNITFSNIILGVAIVISNNLDYTDSASSLILI
jgi:hypothetical protein